MIEAIVYDVSPEEGDTENNDLQKTVSVDEAPADGVDLVIIDVWTDDENTTDNEHINIYAKIKNQGTEKAENFELWWSDDSGKFSSLEGFVSWLGILFTAGFTPLPFKLLTISSGFIHFNILSFVIICIVTRGLRFFLVAFLTYKYGEKFGPFLENKGNKWLLIISILILIIIGTFYFLLK